MAKQPDTKTESAEATAEKKPAPVLFTTQAEQARGARNVALWPVVSDKSNAPKWNGTIDGKRVQGFIRKSAAKGNFVDFVSATKNADNKNDKVATGNIFVHPRGVPKMSVRMAGAPKGEEIYVSIDTKKVPNDLLVEAGLRMDLLEAKRAEVAAARVARESSKAAAPSA